MVRKTIAVVLILVALNGVYCLSSALSWQRLVRRATVRAALAGKLDPNFWPTRGRRSNLETHRYEARRQSTDEEGPFWANRGRSLTAFLPETTNISSNQDQQIPEELAKYLLENEAVKPSFTKVLRLETPLFSTRSDKTDEGPFWANRGRSLSKLDWFNQFQKEKNLGRSVALDEGPFWANRGRSIGKFSNWLDNSKNLLSNLKNRDTDGTSNDVKTDKETPFWANRGRSLTTKPEHFQRNPLYADEPGWVLVPQRNDRRSTGPETFSIANKIDTFWGARGKKSGYPDVSCDENGNHCEESKASDQL